MAQAGDGQGSSTGSLTITVQQQQQQHAPQERLVLRLTPRRKKKVSWKEGTVDNEFMDKKSSKICCIFHKEDEFRDSDSESEDEGGDKGKGKGKGKHKVEQDKHPHRHCRQGSSCSSSRKEQA